MSEADRQNDKEIAIQLALSEGMALIRRGLEIHGMRADGSTVYVCTGRDYDSLWSDALSALRKRAPGSSNKLMSVCFYTSDMPRAVKFYTETLGLEIDFVNGERFARLKFSNGVNLAIKKAEAEREVPGHQTLIIDEQDVEARYEEMQSKGVEFKKELADDSYGMNFSIFDPDGNKVEFVRYHK